MERAGLASCVCAKQPCDRTAAARTGACLPATHAPPVQYSLATGARLALQSIRAACVAVLGAALAGAVDEAVEAATGHACALVVAVAARVAAGLAPALAGKQAHAGAAAAGRGAPAWGVGLKGAGWGAALVAHEESADSI